MMKEAVNSFRNAVAAPLIASALAVTAAAGITTSAHAQHSHPSEGDPRWDIIAPYEKAVRKLSRNCCGFDDTDPFVEIISRPTPGSTEPYVIRHYRTVEGLPLSEPIDIEWQQRKARDEDWFIENCRTEFAQDMAETGTSTCVMPPFPVTMRVDNIRVNRTGEYYNTNTQEIYPLGPNGELPVIPIEDYRPGTTYCFGLGYGGS